MPQLKKILLGLPDPLLKRLDAIAKKKGVSRTGVLREAAEDFVKKEERKLRQELKTGYTEMGKLNLRLAEICFDADQESLDRYEEKLAECE
ncbi:MAG: ribbon-helix-helix protein, CopG family [Clostridia bacterium]|nr:ribbon-helix-helix protein, CopG family [Clostridia bacterium]MBR2877729.1 ribbon-helix-helix protein, CopG family [Clostridia bacterium]MBR3576570.1 ribbon-helix-helix protein, CopG family [Clostridia bacterium]